MSSIGANQGFEFGNDYYNSLQDLTFNSRPIIESHTALAQENSNYASEIVSAIEKRIERAIPNQKLFTLYLMDSIAKNVGLPYTTLFSKNLLKTFTRTYSLVDDATRVKLIKLFKTWKFPTALTGLPLFDSNQLDLIEKFLIKATASTTGVSTPPKTSIQQQQQQQQQPFTEPRLLLIKEIEDLTNMVNSRLIVSPNDNKALQRFDLLNQLRNILLSDPNLPLNQLDSVRQQLQSIRTDEMMKLNALKQKANNSNNNNNNNNHSFSVQQLQSLLSKPNALQEPVSAGINTANAQTLFTMMNSIAKKKSPVVKPSSLQQMPASMNALFSGKQQANSFKGSLGLNDLSFLQNILHKTNSLASSSASPPSHGSPPQQQHGQVTKIDFGFIQPKREQLLSSFILSQDFLSSHKPTEFEISLLYEPSSNQCSNCALRFPDTSEGRLRKQNHLDWHFRINKRIRNAQITVVNRSWYLTQQEWLGFRFDEVEDEGKHSSTGPNANTPAAAIINSSAKLGVNGGRSDNNGSARSDSRDLLKSFNDQYVIIPPGAANETVCDVCKELLSGVFDEDSGEWVWRGAVLHHSTVRHAECDAQTRHRDRSPVRS